MLKLGSTNRFFTRKLILTVLCALFAGAMIPGLFFYLSVNDSLGDTYARKLLSLSIYRNTIVRLSLQAYIPFAAVTAVAIVLFVVFHSHKVVGPLYRIRRFACDVIQGNIGDSIRVRKGDAITTLVDTVNGFSGKYGGIYAELDSLADRMQAHTLGMEKAMADGDQERFNHEISMLNECREWMDRILSGVKV